MARAEALDGAAPQQAPAARRRLEAAGLRRFAFELRRSPKGLTGFALMFVVLACAALAPLLPLADPAQQIVTNRFLPPAWHEGGSMAHLLGGDHMGRDVLSRVIYGARTSIGVAAAVVTIVVVFGTLVGLVSGYFGRLLDTLLMRFVDFQLSFPFLLLALLLLAIAGKGAWQLILALAIGGWPGIARLVRGETIRLRQQEFVQAARGIGVPEWRIMAFHILPNVFPALIVLVTLDFAVIILVEAALSFLGLGIQPPTPSLGTMISDGRNYLYNAPWITLGPGICIMLTAIGINLFGDFLRDTYDPRLAGR